jgi:hypothetical protein
MNRKEFSVRFSKRIFELQKFCCVEQGCQIFLRTKYQNGKNMPNSHDLHLPNVHKKYNKRPKMDQVSIKYIHQPTSSIARHSKIYPNLDFWFENKPSGNPGVETKVKKWKTRFFTKKSGRKKV